MNVAPHPATPPGEQSAWVWTEGTSPLALTRAIVPLVAPAPGTVLVRNEMIGLNPVDWKVLGSERWAAGKVPGVDGAGVVSAVGDGVSASLLGARVAYHQTATRPGSFAQYTAIPARALMRMPPSLSMADAASVPCPALTARLAIDKIPERPGAAILISGAGGGVGNYLVQFAVARGFNVTTMSNPRHWNRLRQLGASRCLPGPLPERSGRAGGTNVAAGTAFDDAAPWGSDRFYAIIDSVDAAHAARLTPALSANGHLVCVQGRVTEWPTEPFTWAQSLHEVALGALHLYGDNAAWRQLTAAGEQIMRQIADGSLQPETRTIGEFGDLPAQLEALRLRAFSGKRLVRIALR